MFPFIQKLKLKRIDLSSFSSFFLKSKFNYKFSVIVFLVILFLLPFLILNSNKLSEKKNQNIEESQKVFDKETSENIDIKKNIKISEKNIENQAKKKTKSTIEKEKPKELITPLKKLKELKSSPKKIIDKPHMKPTQTIEILHKSLKTIGNKSSSDYNSLRKSIKKTYDSEKMIKMIVGREWQNINQSKRNKLKDVFEEYIAKNYIKRFKKIKEIQFYLDGEKDLGNNLVMIKTFLEINKTEKLKINYLLNKKKNTWKIFDVLLAGTISEIATKKSDFSSSLKNGGIDNLIKALEKKNSSILN